MRQIQSIYEILSPDPFLRPFMDNYQAIIRLYGTIRAAYNTSAYIDIELTAKTKELVRKNVKISDLEMPGIIYELNTQQLEKFHQNQTTETVKVLNLSKALFKDVEDKSRKSPFLISIGDRAEKIRQQFENRQIEATEALARLEEIAKERIQVTVKQIQFRSMKRKWASISTIGRLTINTKLLDLPKELGEFVIVHELVHLLVPNHGKLFKCFMSAYLPDWEEKEQKLQLSQNSPNNSKFSSDFLP